MSMNLEFTNTRTAFPFQTPTSLTRAVLKEPNLEKRFQLIDAQLKTWNWTDKERQACLATIKQTLDSGAGLTGV